MLGAGLAAAVGGGIILANNLSFNTNGPNANSSGGTILFIAGTLSTVGSIFPFISSGKNKRKAMQMSAGFKMEKGMPEIKRGMSPSYYPAISVKIPLR